MKESNSKGSLFRAFLLELTKSGPPSLIGKDESQPQKSRSFIRADRVSKSVKMGPVSKKLDRGFAVPVRQHIALDLAGRLMRQDETLSTKEISKPQSAQPATEGSIALSVINLLTAELGEDLFEMWFDHPEAVVVEIDQDRPARIRIQSESEFGVRRIQQSFHREIRTTIDRVCGTQTELIYLVADIESAADQDQSDGACSSVQQPLSFAAPSNDESRYSSRTLRRATPTLQSFHYPSESRLLRAGVEQLFLCPGEVTPLFVHGPTGCGKTMLLEAITADYRRKLRLKRCVYVSAEQFTAQYVASLREGSGLPMFRRKFRDLDLLAIDDIQFLAGKKATLGEFQQTLDNLVRLGKQVVLSADRSAVELGSLGADVCTRISAGLTCSLAYPDLEGRRAIAHSMCVSRELKLSEDVIELLCDRLPRDVRRLSGAINRLQAYARTFGDKITVDFAVEVLGDLFSMSNPVCTSMASIEHAVCELCGVKPAELKSSSRQKRISTARMLAMYLSRQYTGSAFSEIGDFFGGRSHSTVISAERKVKQWIEDDAGIKLPHAQYSAKDAIRRLETDLRIG